MFRNKSDRKELSKLLGYQFKDKTLLLRALTHQSGINEGKQLREIGNFQRLEFLGDSILNLVIGNILFKRHPLWNEGQLTRERSKLVNNKGPLAIVARRLKLGKFLIMGKNEEKHRENVKILSDAMEALLGALWQDTNEDYTFMENFISHHWYTSGLLKPNYTSFKEDILNLNASELLKQNYTSFQEIIRNRNISEIEKISQFEILVADNLLTRDDLKDIFVTTSSITDGIGGITEIILNMNIISPDGLLDALKTIISDGTSIEGHMSNGHNVSEYLTGEYKEKLTLLLSYVADINVIVNPGFEKALSLLQFAIDSLNPYMRMSCGFEYITLEIIEILLQYGANPNWQGSVTSISLEDKNEECKQYNNLETALHTAAQLDSEIIVPLIKLLIKYGANPALKNHENKTPIDLIKETYPNTRQMKLRKLSEILNAFNKAPIEQIATNERPHKIAKIMHKDRIDNQKTNGNVDDKKTIEDTISSNIANQLPFFNQKIKPSSANLYKMQASRTTLNKNG